MTGSDAFGRPLGGGGGTGTGSRNLGPLMDHPTFAAHGYHDSAAAVLRPWGGGQGDDARARAALVDFASGRVRLPRGMGRRLLLEPYEAAKALMHEVLARSSAGGWFVREGLEAFYFLVGRQVGAPPSASSSSSDASWHGPHVLLVTSKRVLYIDVGLGSHYFAQPTAVWQCPLNCISWARLAAPPAESGGGGGGGGGGGAGGAAGASGMAGQSLSPYMSAPQGWYIEVRLRVAVQSAKTWQSRQDGASSSSGGGGGGSGGGGSSSSNMGPRGGSSGGHMSSSHDLLAAAASAAAGAAGYGHNPAGRLNFSGSGGSGSGGGGDSGGLDASILAAPWLYEAPKGTRSRRARKAARLLLRNEQERAMRDVMHAALQSVPESSGGDSRSSSSSSSKTNCGRAAAAAAAAAAPASPSKGVLILDRIIGKAKARICLNRIS